MAPELCPKIEELRVGPISDLYVGDMAYVQAIIRNYSYPNIEWTVETTYYGSSLSSKSTYYGSTMMSIPSALAAHYQIKAVLKNALYMGCADSEQTVQVDVKPVRASGVVVLPGEKIERTTRATYRAQLDVEDRGMPTYAWEYRYQFKDGSWGEWHGLSYTSREYKTCENALGNYEVKVIVTSGGVKSEASKKVVIVERPVVKFGPYNYIDHWAWEVPEKDREVWAIMKISISHPPVGVEVCSDEAEITYRIERGPGSEDTEQSKIEFNQGARGAFSFAGSFKDKPFEYIGALRSYTFTVERDADEYATAMESKIKFDLGEERDRSSFRMRIYTDLPRNFNLLTVAPEVMSQVFAMSVFKLTASWDYDAPKKTYTKIEFKDAKFLQAKCLSSNNAAVRQVPLREPDLWRPLLSDRLTQEEKDRYVNLWYEISNMQDDNPPRR